MRYAVLGDVHANVRALDAVLQQVSREDVQRIVVVGDLVGYGREPEACVARLLSASATCIAGNHDRVAGGAEEPEGFGPEAERAIRWTRANITPATSRYLASLPIVMAVDRRFVAFHACLRPPPSQWLHLSNPARVRRALNDTVGLCAPGWVPPRAFFGHTHRPVVHRAAASRRGIRGELTTTPGVEGTVVRLELGAAVLVNPGSVGEPRDGDPRPSFVVYDADREEVTFRRVAVAAPRVRRFMS